MNWLALVEIVNKHRRQQWGVGIMFCAHIVGSKIIATCKVDHMKIKPDKLLELYMQATNLPVSGMSLAFTTGGPPVCSSQQYYHWWTARGPLLAYMEILGKVCRLNGGSYNQEILS